MFTSGFMTLSLFQGHMCVRITNSKCVVVGILDIILVRPSLNVESCYVHENISEGDNLHFIPVLYLIFELLLGPLVLIVI